MSTPPLKPVDAATLIIVRSDGASPRVLLGRRHERHTFMPGKFVFPGGRVDPEDRRVEPARDLPPETAARLLMRMRGRPSLSRARALAMAAVRETFEEVGLILGAPLDRTQARGKSRHGAWSAFFENGYAPDLSRLAYFARAITPPTRTRRFDSRFFVVDADAIANLDEPAVVRSEELLTPHWATFAEAYSLDLPSITRDILERLEAAWTARGVPADHPLPFRYLKGKTWRCDYL